MSILDTETSWMYRYSGQLPANGHLYTEPLGFEMNYLKLLRVDFHSRVIFMCVRA